LTSVRGKVERRCINSGGLSEIHNISAICQREPCKSATRYRLYKGNMKEKFISSTNSELR
jgi:hypothetical protein